MIPIHDRGIGLPGPLPDDGVGELLRTAKAFFAEKEIVEDPDYNDPGFDADLAKAAAVIVQHAGSDDRDDFLRAIMDRAALMPVVIHEAEGSRPGKTRLFALPIQGRRDDIARFLKDGAFRSLASSFKTKDLAGWDASVVLLNRFVDEAGLASLGPAGTRRACKSLLGSMIGLVDGSMSGENADAIGDAMGLPAPRREENDEMEVAGALLGLRAVRNDEQDYFDEFDVDDATMMYKDEDPEDGEEEDDGSAETRWEVAARTLLDPFGLVVGLPEGIGDISIEIAAKRALEAWHREEGGSDRRPLLMTVEGKGIETTVHITRGGEEVGTVKVFHNRLHGDLGNTLDFRTGDLEDMAITSEFAEERDRDPL